MGHAQSTGSSDSGSGTTGTMGDSHESGGLSAAAVPATSSDAGDRTPPAGASRHAQTALEADASRPAAGAVAVIVAVARATSAAESSRGSEAGPSPSLSLSPTPAPSSRSDASAIEIDLSNQTHIGAATAADDALSAISTRSARRPALLASYLPSSRAAAGSHSTDGRSDLPVARAWSWTSELLSPDSPSVDDPVQTRAAASGACSAAAATAALALSSPAASPLAAAVSQLDLDVPTASAGTAAASAHAALPATALQPSYFDGEDDAEMDDVDVDAIAAAAVAAVKDKPPVTTAASSLPPSRIGVIDLTDESQGSQQLEGAMASRSVIDIEDAAAACCSNAGASSSSSALTLPSPLSLRSRPTPPVLSVTDFSSLHWCELQVDLSLRVGRRLPPPAAQAVMERGTAIHLAYELETSERVDVAVASREDAWALRLLNMMMGLQELTVTGRTRELPVFGCVRLPSSQSPSQPADQPRWVWIMGTIDEVVRLDILQRDQHRKQQQRDQIDAMEEAEKVRKATARAGSGGRASSDKRKRDSGRQETGPLGSETSSAASAISGSALPMPQQTSLVTSPLGSSVAAVVHPSVPDHADAQPHDDAAPVGDVPISQLVMSVDVEQELRIEQQMSAEAAIEPNAAIPIVAAAAAESAATTASADCLPASAAAAASSSAGSAPSLPARPASPTFPVSSEFAVLDHKSRARNCMPLTSQKISTYLQVSIYKMLIDRWLGPSEVDHQRSSSGADRGQGQAAADADSLRPPFSLSRFFSDFRLDPSRPLGAAVQSHLRACGLSGGLTLDDLLHFTLGQSKVCPRTHARMHVEYEWQRDSRFIGSDSYAFDGAWLQDEMDHHLKYWMGLRQPEAVSLGDGFKCARCDYQDVCDSRVVRYSRVGRLVEDQPGEGAAALAVIADSAAIACASAASPAATLAVDDQPSPASKRIKQQQSEQPTCAPTNNDWPPHWPSSRSEALSCSLDSHPSVHRRWSSHFTLSSRLCKLVRMSSTPPRTHPA